MTTNPLHMTFAIFVLALLWVGTARADEPKLEVAPQLNDEITLQSAPAAPVESERTQDEDNGIMLPAEPIPADPDADAPMFIFLLEPTQSATDAVVVHPV